MITKYENWKPIKGYEDYYMVSSKGKVKSRRRVIYRMVNGYKEPSYIMEEKLLTPTDNGNGYLIVGLQVENKREVKYVHRLVAEAFIPNPLNLEQVNHRDYDRKNNKVENLEWCSCKENTVYSLVNQPSRRIYKTNSGFRYITVRNGRFRVNISKLKGKINRVDKSFNTLEEAIEFRNYVLSDENYEVKELHDYKI